MDRSWIGAVLAASSLCGLFSSGAFAHLATGIFVNAKGELFFIHTGRGVCKIDAEKPWTPTGVAVHGKDIFVLEYTNPEKPGDWAPRVRKLGPDGKVTILATLASDENKRQP